MDELGNILKKLGQPRQSGSPTDMQPPGDAEPDNDCPRCGGRGWYTLDVPVGSPDFGKAITCECQKERMDGNRMARLVRYSNLGALTRYTFDTVDTARLPDPEAQRQLAGAVKHAREYADNPSGWLLLTGPHGSGKTHLAAAIANHRIKAGHLALFVHVSDLMDHLRASFSPTSDITYTDLFDQVRNAPLMILDGLGSQTSSTWAMEKLQQIINHRFNAELPTVVTSARELAELDPYIASRLGMTQMCQTVRLPGKAAETAGSLGRLDPQMAQRMTFEWFTITSISMRTLSREHQASLSHALEVAKSYSTAPDGWLTLFGETGVGKTHLAVAIAGEQLRKGKKVFFAFVPELLDYLRSTYAPQSQVTYDRLFEQVKNADLLVLDDLGQEHSTPWAAEKLYQILVHRHNRRLPTVVTTRINPIKESSPIASRLQDLNVGELVNMDAPDYRRSVKSKGQAQHTPPPQSPRRPPR